MAKPNDVKIVPVDKAPPKEAAGSEKPTNLATVYPKDAVGNFGEVSGEELIDFAKKILLFLFILVVFVFAVSYAFARLSPADSPVIKVVDSILDITKTAVPSIVTLVLGFYFGKKTPSSG